MDLELSDIEYLLEAATRVKSDKPIKTSVICPECGEMPEPGDDAHITLTESRWGYTDERPIVLIGCQGYHILTDYL